MNYAQLLFPDFSLILCGYLLCRYTALDRTIWSQVESLVYYFLFPVLLFHSIVKSPIDLDASSFIISGVVLGLSGILLSYALPYIPLIKNNIDLRDHACSSQVGFRFNSFIALALVDRLLGAPGLLLLALLIGFCVPMFNIAAVWPMAKHGKSHFLSELLKNPLVVGTVLGLTANLSGIQVPTLLEPTLNRIGSSSIALGLMVAGAGLELKMLNHQKTLGVSLLTIRHLILPFLAWGLARWFSLDATQTTVLLTFSALPTASTCYVLAVRMGYNGPYVAGLVTLSTLCGMASLTLALGLLQ